MLGCARPVRILAKATLSASKLFLHALLRVFFNIFYHNYSPDSPLLCNNQGAFVTTHDDI